MSKKVSKLEMAMVETGMNLAIANLSVKGVAKGAEKLCSMKDRVEENNDEIETYFFNRTVERLFEKRQAVTGLTALHIAAVNNDQTAVVNLVSLGADINAGTRQDIGYATIAGRKARESFEEDNACTPAHKVAEHATAGMMNLLISLGADLDLKNAVGKTALDVALEHKNNEVAKVIEKSINKGAYPLFNRIIAKN